MGQPVVGLVGESPYNIYRSACNMSGFTTERRVSVQDKNHKVLGAGGSQLKPKKKVKSKSKAQSRDKSRNHSMND